MRLKIVFALFCFALLNISVAQNVGIGTTTPAYKLHVLDTNGNNTVAHFISRNHTGEIFVSNNSGTALLGVDNDGIYSGSGGNTDYRLTTGGRTRLFIRQVNGHTGIGTITPLSRLDVREQAQLPIIGNFSAAGGTGQIHVSNNSDTAQLGVDSMGMFIGTLDSADFRIRTESTDRLIIKKHSGNTGIGTSVPLSKLHVSDNSFPSGILQSSSTFGTWFSIGNTGGGNWFQLIATGTDNTSSGPGKLLITRGNSPGSTSGSLLAITHSTGYTGIGTSNPASRLEVVELSGSINTIARFRATTNNTGQILVSNNTISAVVGADNTGAYSGSAGVHNYRLTTGGVDRLVINAATGDIRIDQKLGIGNTGDPVVTLQVNGAIAAGSAQIMVSGPTSVVNVNDRSYVRINNTSNLPTSIILEDGLTDGQVLVVEVQSSGAGAVQFLDLPAHNTELSSNFVMNDNDTLTLIWNAGFNKWVELNRSAN